MRNIALAAFIISIFSSCKLLDEQVGCSEFFVKNELSSSVTLKNYKLIDSGFYFTLDSALIAPNETKMVNQDCRNGIVEPFPKGAYTKFFFTGGKTKIDTFSRLSTFFDKDSINIYNRDYWIIENLNNNLLKKATYIISAKDSLEAR